MNNTNSCNIIEQILHATAVDSQIQYDLIFTWIFVCKSIITVSNQTQDLSRKKNGNQRLHDYFIGNVTCKLVIIHNENIQTTYTLEK